MGEGEGGDRVVVVVVVGRAKHQPHLLALSVAVTVAPTRLGPAADRLVGMVGVRVASSKAPPSERDK